MSELSQYVSKEDHVSICSKVAVVYGMVGFLLGSLFTFLALTIPV